MFASREMWWKGWAHAPHIEHTGFLHLGWIDRNRIYRLKDAKDDLDASFYSTDCRLPDQALFDAVRAQFHVQLPVTQAPVAP